MRRMELRGYKVSILWRKLRHHLNSYYTKFGDTIRHPSFNDIRQCYYWLCLDSSDTPRWESSADDWV